MSGALIEACFHFRFTAKDFFKAGAGVTGSGDPGDVKPRAQSHDRTLRLVRGSEKKSRAFPLSENLNDKSQQKSHKFATLRFARRTRCHPDHVQFRFYEEDEAVENKSFGYRKGG
jgi:hypothetical protein